MSKNDGGPAFPSTRSEWLTEANAFRGQYRTSDGPYKGMTLRDWFAGMALNAFLQTIEGNDDPHGIAPAAYSWADDMLAEREKGD